MYKKNRFFSRTLLMGPKTCRKFVCLAYKSGSHSEQTRILKNVNVHRHFSYLVNATS